MLFHATRIKYFSIWVINIMAMGKLKCRNPSFGLTTKVKGLQGCGPRGSPGVKAKKSQGCETNKSSGVTSHIPRNVRKCEGV